MRLSLNKSQGLIEVAVMMLGLIASVVLLSLNSARAKSRDAKRMADVRMTASVLEVYNNSNGQYPEKLSALQPGYIDMVPVAPLPPDGTCTAENNEYKFALLNINDFELSFCLGQPASGYAAGKRILGPQGIR